MQLSASVDEDEKYCKQRVEKGDHGLIILTHKQQSHLPQSRSTRIETTDRYPLNHEVN